MRKLHHGLQTTVHRVRYTRLKRAERVAQASALGSPRAAMPAGDRW